MKVRTERHGGDDISSRKTFQGSKVRKPLLAVSGVIDNGNIVIFDGSGSFILLNTCAAVASMRKAMTGVQGRIPHAKMESSSCERGNLKTNRRRVSVGESTRLSKPGAPVRPLEEKE